MDPLKALHEQEEVAMLERRKQQYQQNALEFARLIEEIQEFVSHPLQGSEKQVKWGQDIRTKFVERYIKDVLPENALAQDIRMNAVHDWHETCQHTEARWWIDNRMLLA